MRKAHEPSPFFVGPASVRVQSVLYQNAPERLLLSMEALANAARITKQAGLSTRVSVAYGDASPARVLTDAFLENLRRLETGLDSIDYEFFGANLMHSGGQNRLAEALDADFLLILNPDVVVAPNTLCELLKRFKTPGVGIAEGRQLPLEHPKDYDVATGETSWSSGACLLIPAALFREVSGFDAESFPMYCDDVDLSWRVRLAGYDVIFAPNAAAFHAKRLTKDAAWIPSEAEKYYSAEAALFMAHKYGRSDLLSALLREWPTSREDHLRRAAGEFLRRQTAGDLPAPLDARHLVAGYDRSAFAPHRFLQ